MEEAVDSSEDKVEGEEEEDERVQEEAVTHQPSQDEIKDYVPH